MSVTRCPACDRAELQPMVDMGEVPALCGVTWEDAAEAVASPRGRMVLGYCPDCAYVYNEAFDAAVMEYDGRYDNTLHFSGTFRAYASGLAQRLAKSYDLAGKSVLELGCGKGEFLTDLCHVAGCRGTGYDVSYDGRSDDPAVTFVREYFPFDGTPQPYDFLVNRHVLEHLEDPFAFLVGLRQAVEGRDAYGYFEVPNGEYNFVNAGWDCIYPHVSYFNAAALQRIVERAGFEVRVIGTSFDDQFLYVEVAGGTARGKTPWVAEDGDALERQLAHVSAFGSRWPGIVADWRRWLGHRRVSEERAALWGAGAQGVAFLNAVDRDGGFSAVVDINPNKWGRHVPNTGHRIVPPEDLVGVGVTTVVITNPAYQAEIAKNLADLGIDAEIVVA
jgi:SAM-dependent methyltransferase